MVEHATTEDSRAQRQSLCHVCVVTAHSQIDLAIPDNVPLILLLPELIDIARSRGVRELPTDTAQRWSLAKVGQAPLDLELPLTRLGVTDGDVLVLGPTAGCAPPPIFDDVIEAVAHNVTDQPSWIAGRGRLLSFVCMVIAGFAASLTLTTSEPLSHLPLAFAGVLLCPAALAVAYRAQPAIGDVSAGVLTVSIAPVTALAAAHAVPGQFGPPHILVAGTVAGAVAAIGLRLFPRAAALLIPLLAVGAVVSLGAAISMAFGVGVTTMSAAVIAFSPVVVSAAPRVAMLTARLPLPPVPTPGTPLSVVDAAHECLDEVDERSSRLRAVELTSAAAGRHLTGVVAAAAILASGASGVLAWREMGTGELASPVLLLAGTVAAALMLRGRSLAATAPALWVTGSGAAIALCLLVTAVFSADIPATVVFTAAVVTVGIAFVFGSLAPNRSFSPLQYRLAELLEYSLLAAIVPLAVWALGVFSLVRGL